VFQSLHTFYKIPFSFKNSNSELKMFVTWKCFDGIQREEISMSDVRNQFRFQLIKHCFSDSLIVKCLCIILEVKKYQLCNHYFSIVFQEINNIFCNVSMFSNSIKH